MDAFIWSVRGILILVGIILMIIVLRGKKGYAFRFLTIGITALTLGVVCLIVSFFSELSFDFGTYLASIGAVIIIIGLVIRNIWEKGR